MPTMTAESLTMTDEQRDQLEQMARSQMLAHREVIQARALRAGIDHAQARTDVSVVPHRRATSLGATRQQKAGVGGSPRRGADGRGCQWARWPRWSEPTQKELPDGSTHWTTPSTG